MPSPKGGTTRRGSRLGLVLVAITALVAGLAVSAPAGAVKTTYPVGSAASGYLALSVHPGGSPAGVNVWSCRPGPAHPRPVILLPGTLWMLQDSFAALGPILANAGYCVYGLDYGQSVLTKETGGRVAAAGDIPTSAQQLAAFVDRVLQATGAIKADVVGWSQGGMMPRYYLRFLGGASKIDKLIGLASSNHGTTLDGMFTLLADTRLLLGTPLLTLVGCLACTQQENDSSFIATLDAGGDTVPGVRYTVIESTHDEIVTPYRSAFLAGPDVRNITLQDQCPGDASEHLAMPYDGNAIQDILNALGPQDPTFQPKCELSLPLIGTP